MLSLMVNPFVDPTRTLFEFLSDRLDRYSGFVQTNRQASPLRFNLLGSCHASHTAPPAGGEYAAFHDMLTTPNVKLHDVLITGLVHDVLIANT
jgi:hypothetical protein